MISTDQAKKEEGGEATGRRDPQTPLVLLPGVRERLNQRLDCVGIPQRGRLTYVAALTDRAVQSVSRWFESNAQVCRTWNRWRASVMVWVAVLIGCWAWRRRWLVRNP